MILPNNTTSDIAVRAGYPTAAVIVGQLAAGTDAAVAAGVLCILVAVAATLHRAVACDGVDCGEPCQTVRHSFGRLQRVRARLDARGWLVSAQGRALCPDHHPARTR